MPCYDAEDGCYTDNVKSGYAFLYILPPPV